MKGRAMTKYARAIANCEHFDSRTNLEECVKRAHAESNKHSKGPRFFAWNRVLRELWAIRDSMDAESEDNHG